MVKSSVLSHFFMLNTSLFYKRKRGKMFYITRLQILLMLNQLEDKDVSKLSL